MGNKLEPSTEGLYEAIEGGESVSLSGLGSGEFGLADLEAFREVGLGLPSELAQRLQVHLEELGPGFRLTPASSSILGDFRRTWT